MDKLALKERIRLATLHRDAFNDAYTILSKLEGKITAADSETNKVTIVLDMDPTDVKIGSKVKVTLEQ